MLNMSHTVPINTGEYHPADPAACTHDACRASAGFREKACRLRNERRPDRAVGEACRKAAHERHRRVFRHGQRQQERRACQKAANERLFSGYAGRR